MAAIPARIDDRSFDLADLEYPFTEEEILGALQALPRGKAPGPDGFTSEFLVACWDTIKADICEVFDKFYSMNGRSLQRLNEALITLLPKKPDATTLFDYRPISLIHLVAKLFAKVLSLRLAPRLGGLVSANQSAFIAGRSIHDNFMYVRNLAWRLHKSKAPSLLFKLDIRKAFDSVKWEYLLDLLRRRGFPSKFREWIAALLCSSSSRILLNGVPGAPIKHGQGLRQGDPSLHSCLS